MAAWVPQSFEDACKRNAGRRKREARANRILRILDSMDSAGLTQLLDTTYGLVSAASVELEVSKATASRDFALMRRIHRQFGPTFGRSFDPKRDKIFWIWDWSHYGFIAPESIKAGYHEPVGHFPFDIRKQETEDSYGGFTQLSWHNGHFASQLSTRDLIRVLTPIYRRQGRL